MPKSSLVNHNDFIAEFLERLDTSPAPDTIQQHITILARSPLSPVVIATLKYSHELKRRKISLQAIFAELGPENTMADFCDSLEEISGEISARDQVRWARNTCLKDAHEQLTLGVDMCWSGDCMRREPGKRDSLDLFESEAPQVVRLGTLAFDAIWSISELLPLSAINSSVRVKPSGAYAAGHQDRLMAFSFLKKSGRTNPLAH